MRSFVKSIKQLEKSMVRLLQKLVLSLKTMFFDKIDSTVLSDFFNSFIPNFSFFDFIDQNNDHLNNFPHFRLKEPLIYKIEKLQQSLIQFLDFVLLLEVNYHQCVFLFNKKKKLIFIHEPPYNIRIKSFAKQLDFNKVLLPMNSVFHSRALNEYIEYFLNDEFLHQNDVLNNNSIIIHTLLSDSTLSSKYQSFYVIIDLETFINLELGAKNKEFSSIDYHQTGKELNNDTIKHIGLTSNEDLDKKLTFPVDFDLKNQLQLKMDPKISTDSEHSNEVSGEDSIDEILDYVEELLPQKMKEKTHQLAQKRHSLGISSDSGKIILKNRPLGLLKRSNTIVLTHKQFYDNVKNTYAMEFLPRNLLPSNVFDQNLNENDNLKTSRSSSKFFSQKMSKEEIGLDEFLSKMSIEESIKAEKNIEDSFILDWNHNILNQSEYDDIGLTMKIFRPHLDSLKINISEFCLFVFRSKFYYNRNSNPFHNFKHGVSVLFSAHHFFKSIDFLKDNFKPHLHFAFLLAAFAHDLDHTGKNNVFEINTRSKLALKYNDQSPLENHHIKTLFSIINSSENTILGGFSDECYSEIRTLIIECILATDMKVHFNLAKKFETMIENPKSLKLFEKKSLILGMVVHSADISGSAKNIDVAKEWSAMISKEFTEQYNLEVKHNIPVTPYFKDLNIDINMYKSEISFLKFIVQPLFELLGRFNFDLNEESADEKKISEKNKSEKYFEEINKIIQTNIKIYENKMASIEI